MEAEEVDRELMAELEELLHAPPPSSGCTRSCARRTLPCSAHDA